MKTQNTPTPLRSALLGISLVATLPCLSQATVIYSEDFESYTAGSAIQQLNVDPESHWLYSTNKNDVSFTAQDDATDIFSSSSNQYGVISDTSTTNNQSISIATTKFAATETGSLTFDFYDSSQSLFNGEGFLLRIGPDSGNGGTAFGLWIQNGTIYSATGAGSWQSTSLSSYTLNTAHNLNIVFNNSSDAVGYEGDTIDSNTMNIYLDGVLIGDNLGGSGGSVGSAIELLNFTSITSSEPADDFAGTIYLDNITVDNSIPESSSSALLIGLGATLFALVQRRRKALAQ
ncbi:hypothetical protein [Ruficoccus sp. ZRK36]|uniref:hypothetical protein n=1 Tax=Ruficoccus sp. ZRK36 TaxID=2866311 RepID=UPI001C72E611|nr:hypothetical protein [Ruficoccus sp. ZRK36]QYY37250.1 hypothetical protein K0V07_07140 [Ruficoccus sp. ZRK36]